MKQLPPPAETLEDVNAECITRSYELTEARLRDERAGGGDRSITNERQAIVDHFCETGGLLDRYIIAQAIEVIPVGVGDEQ